MIPCPRPSPQVHDPDLTSDVRQLDCRRYNVCLSLANDLRWDGFTCAECPAYEVMTGVEARADMEGFAKLLVEIAPRRLRRV